MNKEELEVLKLMGDEIKVKNMWLKVYDEETRKEGMVSVNEILTSIVESSETCSNQSEDKKC